MTHTFETAPLIDYRETSPTFRFGNQVVGGDAPTLIIAEIGINHEGDASICAQLIEAAARSGADAIKLQTVHPDSNYAIGTPSHTLFSTACLSLEEMDGLFRLARDLGVEPFTTAGDMVSLEEISRLNPVGYKISSGLLTTTPLIRATAQKGKPIILSSGMAVTAEVDTAVATVLAQGNSDVAVLQCTSIYPAPLAMLNLSVIRLFSDRYGCPCGYSDHTDGITPAAYAVAAGAKIIEKHLTLDTSRASFDHAISLEPNDFARMVDGVREAEEMLGLPDKKPMPGEREKIDITRRYLAAARDINAGDELDAASILFLRLAPGQSGLPPSRYDDVIGRRAARTLTAQQPITEDDIVF